MPLVVTVDQRDSRRRPDLVPATLAALATVPTLRPFQRTVGDEFQGLLDDPAALPAVLELLLREDEWWIGVGIGAVELPLPADAREGRGPAYLLAREAVTAAKSAPWPVRVLGPDAPATTLALESATWLWASVLARRTTKGWEVADLVARGLSYDAVALKLAITQSAVSQRARAAGLAETTRARTLVSELAARCLEVA
jgi:hypothetical protein